MSSHPDENLPPDAPYENQIVHLGSYHVGISLFILVVAPLFLVAGFTVTAISYSYQGDSILKAMGMALGILSVAAGAVLPIFTILVMRKMKQRQRRLEDAMRTAADGDLTRRIEATEADATDPLVMAFNHMAGSLEENTTRMRRDCNRFRSIQQGITDGIIVFDTHGHVISANPAAEAAMGLLEKQIRGTGHIGINEVEQGVNATDIVPDDLKVKCWLAKKCDHRDCPSHESDDRRCWLQCGIYCHNEIQGTFRQKRDACERCDVYLRNGIRVEEYERAGSHFSVTISPIIDNSGLQEGRGALRLAAHMGMSPQASVFMRLLDLSDQLDEFMDVRTGLIDVSAFFRRHRSAQLMITREGFQKPVIVPIMAKGDLIGVLVLIDAVREEYFEADVRMLRSLAAQIGVAAQNQDYFHSTARAKKAWETIFDSMPDGVSVHDTSFRIVHANRAMAEMLGITKGELIGSTCYKAIHHNGIPVIQCPQKEVMRTGKTVSIETEEPALKKFFRLSVNPVFDADGAVVGLVHVMRDITERKLLREQLLQSEKMVAVGQLVSGVAHELNNPLTGVIGYAQLMLRKSEEGRGTPSPNDIRSIRAVLDLQAYEITLNNITVDTDFVPGLPRTMADLHQIEQVFLNLLNNAVQAVADSGYAGVIGIATRAEGDNVFISVTDNGDGISPENQGRIFDPFFTTREVGKGPGLGLSICYGIIEEHGGKIRVESRKGSGTTMTVELPAAAQTLENTTNGEGSSAAANMKGPA